MENYGILLLFKLLSQIHFFFSILDYLLSIKILGRNLWGCEKVPSFTQKNRISDMIRPLFFYDSYTLIHVWKWDCRKFKVIIHKRTSPIIDFTKNYLALFFRFLTTFLGFFFNTCEIIRISATNNNWDFSIFFNIWSS